MMHPATSTEAICNILICAVVGLIGMALIRAFVPQLFQIDAAYVLAYLVSSAQWFHVELLRMRKEFFDKISNKLKECIDKFLNEHR